MARLIGNVDATGSLSTSVPTPVTDTTSVKLYMPFDVDVQDDSASDHSFTASGGAAVSTTQSKFGGKSLYLDGDAKLETSASSDFTFSTNDFTLEGFMYCTTYGELISCFNQSSPFAGFTLSTDFNNTGKLELFMSDGSGYQTTTSTETYPQNEWVHFACVRAGSQILFFKNGALNGTVALTRSPGNSNNVLRIGCSNNGSGNRFFAGYLDDLRITNGLALYTQSFVPPSQAVGASLSGSDETNSTTGFTSVYLPFDSDVNDDGPLSLSVTAAGNAGISSAQSKFGGNSLSLDGTGDFLQIADHASLEFGGGDLTIEAWLYQNDDTGHVLTCKRDASGTWSSGAWLFGINTNVAGGSDDAGRIQFWAYDYNTGSPLLDFDNGSALSSGWHHFAVTRAGDNWSLFVDGSQVDTQSWTGSIGDASHPVFIGKDSYSGGRYETNGYIDDFRILKGFAKYTASFTAPTSAVTATVSQARNDLAVLYMPFDDGLEDKARNHAVTVNGDAAISATQAQFGGKSLSLDGTGDYLDIPDNSFHFGSDDFTVECWLYHSRDSQSSQATFLDFRNSSSNGFSLTIDANGRLGVYSAHTGNLISASSSTEMSKDAWHHFAYCRSGTTGKMFVDGTELGSATDNANYANTSLRIGARYTGDTQYYVGYIDDILISKKAKYTSAFTAPSAASGGEVTSLTTDSRTFSSVWNLNSAVVQENFKAGTWAAPVVTNTTVTVQVFGAGGAGGAQNAGERGGNGGIVKASKSIAVGTVLKIVVGNGGVGWAQANTGLLQGNTSDPMRGGDIQADQNNQTGGQGGSGSGVFVTSVAHGNAQVVAGGGGGGAGNNSARGGDSHSGTGASDSLNGGDGTGNSSYRGQGATTSAGGSANGSGSGAGAALLGGNSGTSSSVSGSAYNSGGSGGGGYYGGSGAGHGNSAGGQGGGGAGSGYVDSSWTRLSASGMTPKAGSSNANDNPADGADGAVIVTDGAGTTTYSTPGTYDHTVS
tara:strand:- start:1316 stop:4294 length:2979 start_codon:yes stop_codon:yes gene_type:complete